MICQILGLFFNPLTADDNDFLLNREAFLQHLQIPLSEKRKKGFSYILSFDSFLNVFKKKMTLIDDVFSNLGTPKNVVI